MISEDELHRLQDKLMELLVKFQRFCEERDIQFMLTYGTLLGAVRHKGFIPWDDDLDVSMSAQDFQKLERVAKEMEPELFLQTRRTDPGYKLRIAKVRLCDGSRVYEKWDEGSGELNRGPFLDIFVFETYSELGRWAYEQRKRFLSVAAKRRQLPKGSWQRKAMGIAVAPAALVARGLDWVRRCSASPKGQWCFYRTGGMSPVFRTAEIYGTPHQECFNGVWFSAPSDTRTYLEKIYGDFMTLPPVEARQWHMERVDLS